MSKTNKELTIDVAIAAINANPKTVASNNSVSWGLTAQNICSLIKSVHTTLEKIDSETK